MEQRVDGKNKNYPVTIALVGLVVILGFALIMGWLTLKKDSSKVNPAQENKAVGTYSGIDVQGLLVYKETIPSDELDYKEETIDQNEFTHDEGIIDSGEE